MQSELAFPVALKNCINNANLKIRVYANTEIFTYTELMKRRKSYLGIAYQILHNSVMKATIHFIYIQPNI